MIEPAAVALDLPTAAKLAAISTTTLRRAIRLGQLPVIKLGTRRLVRREALEKFIRDHEVQKAIVP